MTSRRPRRSPGRPRRRPLRPPRRPLHRRPSPRRRPPSASAPAPAPAPPPSEPAPPLPYDTSPPAASLETKAAPVRRAGPGAAGKADPDSFLTSLHGPIGLYGISTAEAGPAGHLRVGLHGQFFQSSGFLLPGGHEHPVQRGVHVRLHAPPVGRALRRHHELEQSQQPPRRAEPHRSGADQVVRRSDTGRQGRRADRSWPDRRRRAGVPLPVGHLRPVALAQLDVALGRSGGDAGPAADRRHAASLPRQRQLLPGQLVQPLQLRRQDGHHHRGRDVRLRYRWQQDAHGPRRGRAPRTLHRPRRPAPFRRIPRPGRHRVARSRGSRATAAAGIATSTG